MKQVVMKYQISEIVNGAIQKGRHTLLLIPKLLSDDDLKWLKGNGYIINYPFGNVMGKISLKNR